LGDRNQKVQSGLTGRRLHNPKGGDYAHGARRHNFDAQSNDGDEECHGNEDVLENGFHASCVI
jgi:hypothetical protein